MEAGWGEKRARAYHDDLWGRSKALCLNCSCWRKAMMVLDQVAEDALAMGSSPRTGRFDEAADFTCQTRDASATIRVKRRDGSGSHPFINRVAI